MNIDIDHVFFSYEDDLFIHQITIQEKLELSSILGDNQDEYAEWCMKHIGKIGVDFRANYFSLEKRYDFKSETDALLFKLIFGGRYEKTEVKKKLVPMTKITNG